MSHTLPDWLQRWLGLPAAGSGEGTVWTLENSWPWASWITLLFAAGAVALISYLYARESTSARRAYKFFLAMVRLSLIALVALMIAELTLSLRRTGLPTVAVLVDDSASMGIVDRYGDEKLRGIVEKRIKQFGMPEATRLNQAKTALLGKDSVLTSLAENYKLRLYWLSDAARHEQADAQGLTKAIEDAEPTGNSSRLGQGLRDVLGDLRGTAPAGVIVLTDGITTEGESLGEAARYARRKGVPVFTVALGSEDPVRDLEISDLLVDEVVFVDDIVNFQFKLAGRGYQGREVTVRLRERDQDSVLAEKKVPLESDGKPQPVTLPYRPTEVGEFEYIVDVEQLPDELQTENNRQQQPVSVRKEHIRVLLVQAYPNYEFRYLKNMLERDTTIELKTVLQEADLQYAEQDQSALRGFPIRREELFEYDVLLLGDVNPAFLSSTVMGNIAAFVEEKGGGVIFISGPRYMPLAFRSTPLAALMPIDLSAAKAPEAADLAQGFRPVPTELGLASPMMQLGDAPAETLQIWKNLPEMYWLLEAPGLKPAARVLAEHPARSSSDGRRLPVFCMQFVGAGKVLMHLTDDTWRWRFRVGDALFARYWVQAIRYLSRSKLLGKDRNVDLAADRREYRRGDTVRLRARFIDERLAPVEDDGVTIMLERSGRPNQRVTLSRNATNRGVFEGTVSSLADGRYHAWLAAPALEGKAPAADFVVAAPAGEFQQVQIDSSDLKQAATLTHGKYFTIDQVHKLADSLPPGQQVPIEALPPLPLWNQWWALLAFLGLIISEWILRKRKGML